MWRCAAIMGFALGLACASVHAEKIEHRFIRVSGKVSFAPYAIQDDGGRAAGYSLDPLRVAALPCGGMIALWLRRSRHRTTGTSS